MIRYILVLFLLLAAHVGHAAQGTVNRYFAIVTDLLASNPNDANRSVLVGGLSSESDGQGGLFAWDRTSTEAANSTTIFEPTFAGWTSGVGRWKKINLGAGSTVIDTSGFITNYTFIKVNTIADLKNVSVTNGLQAAEVGGYHNFQDGGEGTFLYYPGSTDIEDGGVVIAPNSETGNPGKWKRVVEKDLAVRYWGPTVTNGTIELSFDYATSSSRKRIRIPNGAHEINAVQANWVQLQNNLSIAGDDGANLVVAANPVGNHALLRGLNVTNVVISGIAFTGWRATDPGDYGTGVYLQACTNVTFDTCSFADFWWDGVIVTSGTGGSATNPCENIRFLNCTFDNNRRTALSVSAGRNIIFENCVFKNTAGAPTEAGVDLEPNATPAPGTYVEYVQFINCRFENNAGNGLYINKGAGLYTRFVQVKNCFFVGNGGNGIELDRATDCDVIGNFSTGNALNGFRGSGERNRIIGNESWLDTGRGFYLLYFDNFNVSDNLAIGSVTDAGFELFQSNSGISDASVMSGNLSISNKTHGFDVRASGLTFVGNGAILNGRNGLLLSSAKNNTITANSFIANSQDAHIVYDNLAAEATAGGNSFTANKFRKSLHDHIGIPPLQTNLTTVQFKLSTNAMAIDDYYNGYQIEILNGTGNGQTNLITDYVASTFIATVSVPWAPQPDDTSEYEIQNPIRPRYAIFNLGVTNRITANDTRLGGESGEILDPSGVAIISLPIAEGGTSGNTAAMARTNLGLGNISVQNAETVGITGGNIVDNVQIAPTNKHIRLWHGFQYQIRDSAGTDRPVVYGDSGNNLNLQSTADGGDVRLRNLTNIIFQAKATATEYIFGAGTVTAAKDVNIHPSDSSGTDVRGSHFTIKTGRGTGNTPGGEFIVEVSDPGASGVTTNATGESFSVSTNGIRINAGPRIRSGSGSPEGVVTGSIGDLWLRTPDGGTATTLYIKESGTATTTGWVPAGAGGGGGLAATDIDTSAELNTIVTDNIGTGALVFATAIPFTNNAGVIRTLDGTNIVALDNLTVTNLISVNPTTEAVRIGNSAGSLSTDMSSSVAIGFFAAQQGTNNPNGVSVGRHAGMQAGGGGNQVNIGHAAGQYAHNASAAVKIGYLAGRFATNSFGSVIVGDNAGEVSTNVQYSVLIGTRAGENTAGAVSAVMMGLEAGMNSGNSASSIFIGQNSGKQSDSSGSIFIGDGSGYWVTTDNRLVIDANTTHSTNYATALITGDFTARTFSPTNLVVRGDTTLGEAFNRPSVALGAGTSIDPTLGNWFTKTLTADTTFTFANLANGQVWNVDLIQDSTPRTVTWPTTTWRGGSTPIMDTGSGVINTFTFRRDGGVTYGDVVQQSDAQLDSLANLNDPGATVILIWDDTHGFYTNATIGAGLTYTEGTHTLSASGSLPADPGANRILIWDDTDNAWVPAVIGSGLTYTAGTDTLTSTGGSLPSMVEWGGVLKEDGTNTFWDVPERTISYFTDFIGRVDEHLTTTTTGAGASFVANAVLNNTWVGAALGQTGTTATGYGGGTTLATGFTPGRGVFRFKVRVNLPVLSDATESYVFVAGLHDANVTNATDGVYFKADSNLNANWQLVSASAEAGGTTETVDSGVAVSTSAVTLEFVTLADWSSIQYYINGVSVGAITTENNIPDSDRTTGLNIRIYKYAGLTSRVFNMDYLKYQYMLNFTR